MLNNPKKKAAVLVESPRTGAGEEAVKIFNNLDIKPIILLAEPQNLPTLIQDAYKELGAKLVTCNTSNLEEVVDYCSSLKKDFELCAVGSVYEYSTLVAAKAARKLNLPGPDPESVAICRTKSSTRKILNKFPDLNPKNRVVTSANEAIKASNEIDYPVIVKPTSLTGSAFVRLCKNAEEVKDQVDLILGLGSYMHITLEPSILIEEYIDGPEFSVEVMDGSIIGITKKHLGPPPYFVEIGHDFPASISLDQTAQISKIVIKALQAIGLTWGAAHVEVRIGPNGPRIIEINPRIAGDRIPELIKLAYGTDMIEANILALLGKKRSLIVKHKKGAAIRFIMTPNRGKLTGIHGLKEVKLLPGVHEVKINRTLGESYISNGSNRDRVAHIIASANSTLEAAHLAEQAITKIRFDWQPII